jgi:GNAT superfamily N-acetyltransferase
VLEIKRVGPDDWSTVRKIRLAALRDTPDWFWATYEEEVEKPESWWREFIEAGAWFLACDHDRPLGIAAVLPAPGLEETARQLISMWVSPEARRQGVGANLIDAIKGWSRETGVRELQLQVTESNQDARRVYERHGFQATGRTEPLPRKPWLLEHEMRLKL